MCSTSMSDTLFQGIKAYWLLDINFNHFFFRWSILGKQKIRFHANFRKQNNVRQANYFQYK